MRANEYAPPACGSAGDISAIEKQSPMYITVMISTASSMPPKPPAVSPKFHPKKSPEMTAPTPIAHKLQHARVPAQLALPEVLFIRGSVWHPVLEQNFGRESCKSFV